MSENYSVITGRRQKQLDEAVKATGENVTAVKADSANFDDLDRLFQIAKKEKGRIDILLRVRESANLVSSAKFQKSTLTRLLI